MIRGRRTGTSKKRKGTIGWKVKAWRKSPYCHYCKARILNPKAGSVDHKIPLAKGGYSKPSNYILACKPCNWAKGTQDYADFLAKMEPTHT